MSYSNYAYPYNGSGQYPQQPSGYSCYPSRGTLSPSTYSSNPMSRGLSQASSNSSSSSSGQSGASTAGTSPGSYGYLEYPLPPQYPTQGIEFSYAGSASVSNKKQPKVKQSSPASSGPPPQYPCLYPGCEHVSTRSFDLQRHMKKHTPIPAEEKYDCPGRGCGRVGIHGFDRKDHMTEHLRNYHAQDIPKGRNNGVKVLSGSSKKERRR